MDYYLTSINYNNKKTMEQFNNILSCAQIKRDANLEYTLGLFTDDNKLVATGSVFGNTLRCLAVHNDYQSQGLLNRIIAGLMEYQVSKGNTHVFLYTKKETAFFFESLGFYKIASTDNVVFMENIKNGFCHYIKSVNTAQAKQSASLVMNCNPFTFGHQYLIEKASKENDIVHLFIVSEEMSLIPFDDRFQMITEGCSHLNNIHFHKTENYMISNVVFPSYFLKDKEYVIKSHANLDLEIFIKIAKQLNITSRYVGEEPYSTVTNIYNEIMSTKLPKNNIDCVIVPRKCYGDKPVSASAVRNFIHERNLEAIKDLVPQTTYNYFLTEKGKAVIKKIEQSSDVIHY